MGDAPRRSFRDRLARAVRYARRVCLGLHVFALACLFLRIVLRDLFVFSEWLFLVPAIVFAVPATLFALPAWGGWRLRTGLAAALLLALVATVVVEQPRLVPFLVRAKNPPVGRTVRLVAWNVMSYNGGEKPVVDGYKEDDPDVVCLLEGTYRRGAPGFLRKEFGPQFEWIGTRQMAMGTRLPVREAEELNCRTRLRIFRARLDVDGQTLTAMLVDMPSPPRTDTADVYDELAEKLAAETGPLVLVGDFNTPRGSWHLGRATDGMRDFYTSSPGTKWLASWRSDLPLYQIDHAFCSEGLVPVAANLRGPDGSDHYRQSVAFVFPTE